MKGYLIMKIEGLSVRIRIYKISTLKSKTTTIKSQLYFYLVKFLINVNVYCFCKSLFERVQL